MQFKKDEANFENWLSFARFPLTFSRFTHHVSNFTGAWMLELGAFNPALRLRGELNHWRSIGARRSAENYATARHDNPQLVTDTDHQSPTTIPSVPPTKPSRARFDPNGQAHKWPSVAGALPNGPAPKSNARCDATNSRRSTSANSRGRYPGLQCAAAAAVLLR